MAKPAGPPRIQRAPGRPEERHLTQQPAAPGGATFDAPSFYITGRQPLSPGAILLAVVAAFVALFSVLYVLGHFRANPAGGQKDADDPDQVDVIVVGAPGDSAVPTRRDSHVSPVHPTILVHLPRLGDQTGFIPNSPAGHLLYDWLAAFNHASYPALAKTLPNIAVAETTAAQLELRRQTGGFALLSAKEVEPGILVFRLRDQSPAATEVLGTLQMRPKSDPATIESFSLRALPPPHQDHPGAGAAPLPPGRPQ